MRFAFVIATHDRISETLAGLDILRFCPVPHDVILVHSGEPPLPGALRSKATERVFVGAFLAFCTGLRQAIEDGYDAMRFNNGDDWVTNFSLVSERVSLLNQHNALGYKWLNNADMTLNEVYLRLDAFKGLDLDAWERRAEADQTRNCETNLADMIGPYYHLPGREVSDGIGSRWHEPLDPDNNRFFCRAWQLIGSHDSLQRWGYYKQLRPLIPYAAELEKEEHFGKWVRSFAGF